MRSIGDVVAIYFDKKPSVYARIEMITPDIKPHWLQVRLLFLSFPPQETTWTLREEYLEGTEFTMKGIPIQVIPLGKPGSGGPSSKDSNTKAKPGEVLSFEKFHGKKHEDDPEDGDS
jgi:hypothetical protein